MDLKSKIRVIEGFPKEGISFKDISTLIKDKDGLRETIDQLADLIKDYDFDYIAGIEARGFIVGAPLSYKMGKGFIAIRKPGKLPGEVIRESYDLEYGSNEIEMDKDALKNGGKVLILDDLLATGGTITASTKLIEKAGGQVVALGALIELTGLKARDQLKDYEVFSLIKYEF